MYTIALVDDEKYSLSDIRHTFPLKAYGFNLVAALTDPMQALSLLPSLKPDVVFVDIRMPELSGLELIRRLKPSLPDSVYVILSGYSEFEYAQSAIRLDVLNTFSSPTTKRTPRSCWRGFPCTFPSATPRRRARRRRQACTATSSSTACYSTWTSMYTSR